MWRSQSLSLENKEFYIWDTFERRKCTFLYHMHFQDRKYWYINKYILAIFDITFSFYSWMLPMLHHFFILWEFHIITSRYPNMIMSWSLHICSSHCSSSYSPSKTERILIENKTNEWTILLLHLSHLSNTPSSMLLAFEATMCPPVYTFVC